MPKRQRWSTMSGFDERHLFMKHMSDLRPRHKESNTPKPDKVFYEFLPAHALRVSNLAGLGDRPEAEDKEAENKETAVSQTRRWIMYAIWGLVGLAAILSSYGMMSDLNATRRPTPKPTTEPENRPATNMPTSSEDPAPAPSDSPELTAPVRQPSATTPAPAPVATPYVSTAPMVAPSPSPTPTATPEPDKHKGNGKGRLFF